MNRRLVGLAGVVLAYAAVGGWMVFVRGMALVPDLYCYRRGSCAWSSPAAAGVGAVAGVLGLRVVTLLGIVALGLLVAWLATWRRALLLLAVMWTLPTVPGLAIGPDALGAAAAVVVWARRTRLWWLPALLHLEAALCVGAAALCGRWPRLRSPWLVAGAGAVALTVMAAIGYLRFGQPPAELQARYLLPGAAVAAAYAGRGVA